SSDLVQREKASAQWMKSPEAGARNPIALSIESLRKKTLTMGREKLIASRLCAMTQITGYWAIGHPPRYRVCPGRHASNNLPGRPPLQYLRRRAITGVHFSFCELWDWWTSVSLRVVAEGYPGRRFCRAFEPGRLPLPTPCGDFRSRPVRYCRDAPFGSVPGFFETKIPRPRKHTDRTNAPWEPR